MRIRTLATALLLLAAVPGSSRAAYPTCKTRLSAARAGAMSAGDVNVHGYGGVLDGAHGGQDSSVLALPGVTMVVPDPKYGPDWFDNDVLYEGDVVGVQIVLNFPGYLAIGSDTTTTRPLGGTPATYGGAQKVGLGSFTGHYKIAKRTYDCASLVKPNTIYHNEFYEFWLNGYQTPTGAGSPLRGYGEATNLAVSPGDTGNH